MRIYPATRLRQILHRIDRRGYKAYKDIAGSYDFHDFILHIDHVQADPFAPPSKVSIVIPLTHTGIPSSLYSNKPRAIALRDYIARTFRKSLTRYTKGLRGSGNSGVFAIDAGGQEILDRSCVQIVGDKLEVRFVMGLPARGRTILARIAEDMFFNELPKVIEHSCLYKNLPTDELHEFVTLYEDASYIRDKLPELGLVAFIGNGAILPRRSGVSELPMSPDRAVVFKAPHSLELELDTPNHGKLRGMGIPKGVTLIVGGGYHGKSTLLRAIERGIYNHVPGDGREWVITIEDTVKIRAEDGRAIHCVDISGFIHNLPTGSDTTCFSTDNASGSTSQAANIIEALELGAKLLLVDEDTSATNFMIRDARMQRLVHKSKEPITPFIDRVRELYDKLGVSTILVMGGSGDYFDVADTVIMMDSYLPKDVTHTAKQIAQMIDAGRNREEAPPLNPIRQRIPLREGIDPRKGNKLRMEAKGKHQIVFGRQTIDLSCVEQLVDTSQTRTIAYAIYYAAKTYVDGKRTISEIMHKVEHDLKTKGFDILAPGPHIKPHNLAYVRRFEIAAALNRLRSLKVKCKM